MIKARPAPATPGRRGAGRRIAPFVWRKHLDFAALADVHDMKRQMQTFRGQSEIAVEGHNVKIGRGGIREIEFFAQTQQLIAGGRHPELRVRPTLEAFDVLASSNWITFEARDELTAAYQFLRRVEHRLQMIADEQTHTLPDDIEAVERFAAFSAMTAAPRLPAICSAISTSCRGITASCSRAIRPAPRNCRRRTTAPVRTIRACSSIWPRSASRSRSWWRRPCGNGWSATIACSGSGIDAERLCRIRSRADRRPRARRRARQCGDGVRPLPRGVAARRAADFAAQPEPRSRRAGGADPRRRAAARRHAGAAAADHGRADRSALLRRDAGPARTVRAAWPRRCKMPIPTRSFSTGCGCSARKACS
jgi:hypothetical protein